VSASKTTQYGAVDLMKFLCVILIISSHYCNEYMAGNINTLLENAMSLYVIAVPFFFACSGFFLFKKVFSNSTQIKSVFIQYIKRIGLFKAIIWSCQNHTIITSYAYVA